MTCIDYKTSGVDIELGDDASKILYNASKITWKNRAGKLGEVVELFDDFSGLRAINVGGLPQDTYMNMSFDGVGTKTELAERIAKHDTVAHITGGGMPAKLGRVLKPSNLGADITEPFTPCYLMLYCQEKGGIKDTEAYKTWNMGQGMIILTSKPDEVISIANKRGIKSQVIGEISSKPGIRIRNKGIQSATRELSF